MMLPLQKYRMLDLSRMLPGPMASSILADMGMDVVKVEEPEPRYGMGRDPLTPPDPTPEEEQQWAAYNSLARNKRSIALNLLDLDSRPRAQQVFYRLVKQADVVLEGYRPRVVEWMGVDYDTLKEHNPGIICCSISGFGQSGPYEKYPGHNSLFGAVGGATVFDHEGNPMRESFALGDMSGALYAAVAILTALLHREQTGVGQNIDVPMAATSMAFNTTRWADHFRRRALGGNSVGRGRGGPSLTYLKCKDGKWLTTSNEETVFWESFCRVLGRPEYIPLRKIVGREADQMVLEIQELFLTKTSAEWLDILLPAGTCVAPVHDMERALDDPQIGFLGVVRSMEHPSEGQVPQIGFPVNFSGTPATLRNFAPVLGQHTRQILEGAGYSSTQIEDLERAGVVRGWTQA